MLKEREKPISVASKKTRPASRWALLQATMTLAFWQLRLIWRLLLLESIGAIAAVMLVCAIPLYTQVEAAANFHSILNSSLSYSSLTFAGEAPQISPSALQQSTRHLEQLAQRELGSFLPAQPQFSLQIAALSVSQPPTPQLKSADISLVGEDMNQSMATHLTIAQGRLPRQDGSTLEIALTPQVASEIHVTVGTTLSVVVTFADSSSGQVVASQTLPLRVVGLFTPKAQDDFWHGETFVKSASGTDTYDVLASNEQIITVFARATKQALAISSTAASDSPGSLYWYYPVNPAHLTVTQTNSVATGLHNLMSQAPNVAVPPAVLNVQLEGQWSQLTQYNASSQVLLLPVTLLALLALALLVFFVSLMAELLVELQTTAIALLHSRGASDEQIFGAMVVQSILLGLLALLFGPVLALLLVMFAAPNTLLPDQQGVLAMTVQQALTVVLDLRWYALPTAGVAVISMILAIKRSVNTNLLVLRREQARSTRHPLWQRLYLDVFAALIALVGYGVSVYITDSGLLNAQLQVLIAGPLAQIAPLFLLIACLLLFLRLFPLLLRLGGWLAAKRRGAAGMLAMSQVARMPGQALRLTLLLTLSVAFLIFCQVLSFSQTQRVLDVAGFQAGADFSGTIQNYPHVKENGSITDYLSRRLRAQEALYERLPGVQVASAGYNTSLTGQDGNVYTLQAVDPTTFARVSTWTEQNSPQPLSALLDQLVAHRNDAFFQGLVPAIVDNALWNQLQLSKGGQFVLNEGGKPVNFVAIASVPSIPTIFDGVGAEQSSTMVNGGLLVDYESYATHSIQSYVPPSLSFFKKVDPLTLVPPNALWLKTSDNPAQLAALRTALTKGALRLAPLSDRRAIIAQLQQRSTQRSLIGIIALASVVPLLLALLGNLFTTWLGIRNRLTSFTILRALGCAPHQLAAILGIELGIVYTTSLFLGTSIGLLLARLAVPALTFTDSLNNTGSTSDVFLAQNIPAVRVVVPSSLLVILGAFLVLCVVVLATMAIFVSRPQIGQSLRINED